MRSLIGLLCAIALLGALAAAVDAGLTRSAEERAAERVVAETGAADATVDLQGWPVMLRLATGTVPRAVLTAQTVPIPDRGAALSSLDVTLTDVALRFDDLSATDTLPVRAATGRFEARLDGEALRTLAAEDPTVAQVVDRIELLDGVVRVVVAGGSFSVDATAEARDGDLVVRPTQPLPVPGLEEVVVPLRDLPAGATVDSLRVEAGALVLEGEVTDLVLDAATLPPAPVPLAPAPPPPAPAAPAPLPPPTG